MSSVESNSSLLIPPNPSLSATKPSASILLNGTGRPRTSSSSSSALPAPGSPPRSTTPQLSSYPSSSFASSYASSSFVPSSPSASSIRSSSAHSIGSASYASGTSTRPTPIRRGSTPKISFAPLPEIPLELKRRNSITIGVASRKNLLTGQGSAAGGGGPRGSHKVMMTDQEWEDYKRQFDEANGANDVVDLGAVAKQGAKALWGKMKRGRSTSTSSTTSSVASSSTTSLSSSSASALGLASATGSVPLAPAASSPVRPGSGAGIALGTVAEEDHGEDSPSTSPRAGFPAGTTSRPRSSSSPPPIGRSGSGAGLHVIPGSPPPSSRSNSNLSPATTMSTISDNETENDTETESGSEVDPEGERQAEAEAESDPHDAGFRAAEASALASLHQKHKLRDHLHVDSGDEGEGDATPRRIPSPPPRRADLGPLAEEALSDDEGASSNAEDDDDDEAAESEIENAGAEAEGTKTPSGLSENGWEQSRGEAYRAGESSHAHAQGRHGHEKAEVLGFDPERFGRALDIAAAARRGT
ncbi:hypothetical protein IAU59_002896 [Kwoniella sp. CBS 9459]